MNSKFLLKMKQIKIAVIGEGAVGKTSLLTTYITNVFPDKNNINHYLPQMLKECSKTINIYGNKVNLIMLDYEYCGLSLRRDKLLYEGTQIFIVCFSINNNYSLKMVKNSWIPDKKAEFPDVPFILVGMKSDLRDTDNSNNYDKEDLISKETAENIAIKTGAICYIECSSKNSININYLFERAIETVYNQQENNNDNNDNDDDKSCCIIY